MTGRLNRMALFAGLVTCCMMWAVPASVDAKGAGHGVPTEAPPVNWMDMDYAEKNKQGGTLDMSKGEQPMGPPLLLGLLNFFIFAGILYWKAGPPLRQYLKDRHVSIKDALAEAAKLQAEAKEKLAEYSARIADADAEVNALIAEIRKDAELEREQIVADANQQAERLQRDAESRIEAEFLAARRKLERDVIAKATAAAHAVLSKQMTDNDHTNLVSNYIDTLQSGSVRAEGGKS